MTQQPLPSLVAFERHVAAREHEQAVTTALQILRVIDETMGGVRLIVARMVERHAGP